jgi:hypothetical protein
VLVEDPVWFSENIFLFVRSIIFGQWHRSICQKKAEPWQEASKNPQAKRRLSKEEEES